MKSFAGGMCLLVLLMGTPAYACSCLPSPPPLEALEQAASVFSGQVVRIATDQWGGYHRRRVTLRVRHYWKDDPGVYVAVYTADNSAACGYDFVEGERYLVYTYAYDGALHTGLCTRTRLLAQAQEDLAALGPGEQPRAQGGVCGGCSSAPIAQAVALVLLGLVGLRRRA